LTANIAGMNKDTDKR